MSRFIHHQLGRFAARQTLQTPVGKIVLQYFGRYYTTGELNFPKDCQGYAWTVDGPRGTPNRLLDPYNYGNVSGHGLPIQT
jgi:hypothetical protein